MNLLLVFLVGLAVGSFLNVCIYRLPRGESIVHPRSRCPHCQAQIAAYDNIPLLSYLLLRGRCRYCRHPIAVFYPLVELASASLLLFLYLRYGLSPVGWRNAVFALLLLVLIVSDLRDRILPDRVTLPGLVAGLLFSFWVPVGDGSAALLARLAGWDAPAWLRSFGDAALGAFVWAALFYSVGELFYRVRRIEGLGLGDVKMVALLGAFLGLKLTLVTILFACLLGIVLGGLYMLLRCTGTRYALPLGTFLGLAGLVALFWGPSLLRMYFSLFTLP